MIRRISKNNDLKDLIKSCPSGVIDDIYQLEYWINGWSDETITATPTKVGTHLEVILPSGELQTFTKNGILYRRAFYKVEDSSYPDGYYNLEFVDCLDVWLCDDETEPDKENE